MDDYRWTRGRVLTLVGVGGLALFCVIVLVLEGYHNAGIRACGDGLAEVVASNAFTRATRYGPGSTRWKHTVVASDGSEYILHRPRHSLAFGSQVEITFQCDRSGTRLRRAWYREA